jgi:uncharacterized protein YbaR (Trm112 family)
MVIYDKLKNMETEEEYFDFICPECNSNGLKKNVFTVKPLNISWKPDFQKNEDIQNPVMRDGYSKLPTLRQALLLAGNKNNDTQDVLIICNKCNNALSIPQKIPMNLLRKWINKHNEEYLDLILTEEEKEKCKKIKLQ